MSRPFTVKPTQTAVKAYYEALAKYADQGVDHEGAVRTAFQNLLDQTGRRFGWALIPELSTKTNGQSIRPDGTFLDDFHMRRGFWEAKDTHDDLEAEIQKKINRGYRPPNTLADTRTGYLYQNHPLPTPESSLLESERGEADSCLKALQRSQRTVPARHRCTTGMGV